MIKWCEVGAYIEKADFVGFHKSQIIFDFFNKCAILTNKSNICTFSANCSETKTESANIFRFLDLWVGVGENCSTHLAAAT